jgi:hypothetical protein
MPPNEGRLWPLGSTIGSMFRVRARVLALLFIVACGGGSPSPSDPVFTVAANQYREIANAWARDLPPEGSPRTEAALVDKFLLLAADENRFRIALEKISFPANIQPDATAMIAASKLLADDELTAMANLSPRHTQAELDAAVAKWSRDWDSRMAADKLLKKRLSI